MRNGGVDALVLLPILNGDDASVLEALDVPEPGLEQRAHQAGEAGGRVSTLLQHHHSVQATWKGGRGGEGFYWGGGGGGWGLEARLRGREGRLRCGG